MATKQDEFEPGRLVVERVFLEAIRPVLSTCEEVIGRPIVSTLAVWVQNEPRSSIVVSAAGIGAHPAPASGEIRVRFRKTFKTYRTLYSAEAIFPVLLPGTGFSGFSVQGAVLDDGGNAHCPTGGRGLSIQRLDLDGMEIKACDGLLAVRPRRHGRQRWSSPDGCWRRGSRKAEVSDVTWFD